MSASTLLTANEIVQRFSLSYQTLNYYTNLGLLNVVKRDGNGRLYDSASVEHQLGTISRLKDEGYPLRLISKVLSGAVNGNGANGNGANGNGSNGNGHGALPSLPVLTGPVPHKT
jgi:DNA-binding transcriptional MerR regulator